MCRFPFRVALSTLVAVLSFSSNIYAMECHWYYPPSSPAEWVCENNPVYFQVLAPSPDWGEYSNGDVVFCHLNLGIIDSYYVVPADSQAGPPPSFGTSYEIALIVNGSLQFLNLRWYNISWEILKIGAIYKTD